MSMTEKMKCDCGDDPNPCEWCTELFDVWLIEPGNSQYDQLVWTCASCMQNSIEEVFERQFDIMEESGGDEFTIKVKQLGKLARWQILDMVEIDDDEYVPAKCDRHKR